MYFYVVWALLRTKQASRSSSYYFLISRRMLHQNRQKILAHPDVQQVCCYHLLRGSAEKHRLNKILDHSLQTHDRKVDLFFWSYSCRNRLIPFLGIIKFRIYIVDDSPKIKVLVLNNLAEGIFSIYCFLHSIRSFRFVTGFEICSAFILTLFATSFLLIKNSFELLTASTAISSSLFV